MRRKFGGGGGGLGGDCGGGGGGVHVNRSTTTPPDCHSSSQLEERRHLQNKSPTRGITGHDRGDTAWLSVSRGGKEVNLEGVPSPLLFKVSFRKVGDKGALDVALASGQACGEIGSEAGAHKSVAAVGGGGLKHWVSTTLRRRRGRRWPGRGRCGRGWQRRRRWRPTLHASHAAFPSALGGPLLAVPGTVLNARRRRRSCRAQGPSPCRLQLR